MKSITKIVMTLSAIALLSACGLKGELYLPKQQPMPDVPLQTLEQAPAAQQK